MNPTATIAAMRSSLRGRKAFGGLDLSGNTDLSAFVLVFPWDSWGCLARLWLPEGRLEEREKSDGVPYRLWRDQGFLSTTPGTSIRFDQVRSEILSDCSLYSVQAVAYDNRFALESAQKLDDHGLTMVHFQQSYSAYTPACISLENLYLHGQLSHGGHPVLRWMAENVTLERSPDGLMRPIKDSQNGKRVDGIVALLMAIGLSIRHKSVEASVYESWFADAGALPEMAAVRGAKSIYEDWFEEEVSEDE